MAPRKNKPMQAENIKKPICLRHKKNNNKKERKGKEPSWSDLPTEILEYIISRLYLSDITSFHRVCKQWRSIKFPPAQQLIKYPQRHIRPMNHQIPWLMISNCCRLLTSPFTLIAPYSSPENMKIHTIKIEGMQVRETARVCSNKFGWLLLARSSSGSATSTSFFLFSPFINRRINLPNFNSSEFDAATFSSSPTSPDCMLFVVHYTDRVNINICRVGDTVWSSSSFPGKFSQIKDVVYLKGVLYCLTSDGALMAFNVAQRSWSVLPVPLPTETAPSYFHDRSYMVGDENDGEVLLVLMNNLGLQFLVHKLDESKTKWAKVDDLTDKSLFVNSCTSFVISKNQRTKREMHRIYFFLSNDELPKFHSLKVGRRYPSCLHYGHFPNKGCHKRYWIEPPS